MTTNYLDIPHNHEIIAPTDNSLYHPDCDPRKLQNTCPACKALMEDWALKVEQMIKDRA